MDYEKLTNDLKQALAAAKSVTQKDYGTYNFDTPYIEFSGDIDREKVKAAAKAAGIFCIYDFGNICYLYGMTGNQLRRTAEAEAIAYKLADLGWNAGVRYRID